MTEINKHNNIHKKSNPLVILIAEVMIILIAEIPVEILKPLIYIQVVDNQQQRFQNLKNQ